MWIAGRRSEANVTGERQHHTYPMGRYWPSNSNVPICSSVIFWNRNTIERDRIPSDSLRWDLSCFRRTLFNHIVHAVERHYLILVITVPAVFISPDVINDLWQGKISLQCNNRTWYWTSIGEPCVSATSGLAWHCHLLIVSAWQRSQAWTWLPNPWWYT